MNIKEIERKIYKDLREELDLFDWDAAHMLLEGYLKKCSFIGYLVYLKHRGGQAFVSQKKFNLLKKELQRHHAM